MSLTLGRRLGSYEVLAPLGAGGMGEVFRARDVRLDRIVALKVLPRAFAAEPERLARFEREARLLAALNHPNVGAIYGLEDADGTPCLVLEFIEGESLAARLARGPLPVREAMEVATAIAAGIEAAHARGIVHRDLKPGNVMLTPARGVKVLDFGLARAGGVEAASVTNLSLSPTIAVGATDAGTVLGTAAYMSPEQARGRPADARTDVWALGCILYECLAGRAAFSGESSTDVIAQVIARDPDWGRLPTTAPPRLHALIRRCLAKDADARFRDVAEMRHGLDEIVAGMSAPPRGPSSASGIHAASPSLAVLYFENLAEDKDSEYFCAGITEDILTDLSKIRGLRVASRNAVARYRGAPADLAKVAADLGVTTVLEGSVRRAGDRVRITTQLVNANDGFQLWAERFDRSMADVFAVQEEIASAIAAALRVALTPSEAEAIAKNRPQDVKAYDLYLRGRAEYSRYTKECLEQAMELFEEATRVDPGYALAWAGIADCHGQFIQWGHTSDVVKSRDLGLAAARRAQELDPRLPEAWKAEGLVRNSSGDPEGAQRAQEKALEIDPRFTPALLNYGVGLFRAGQVAGAERVYRRVLEIDPQEAFALSWLIWVLELTGRDDEIVALVPTLRAASDGMYYVVNAHTFRGSVRVRRGDVAGALECVREAVADGAPADHMQPLEALALHAAGRTDEARQVLARIEPVKLGAFSLAKFLLAAMRLGEPELALRALARPIVANIARLVASLYEDLHPLLDREPFAPARRLGVLVWPVEAPMPTRRVLDVFEEVRLESGRPEGSRLPFRG